MKKRFSIFFMLIIGICLFPLTPLKSQSIEIEWHTFLGENSDCPYDLALDSAGNIYVIGDTDVIKGIPINSYTDQDIFVAKLDSSGNLSWLIILGGGSMDFGTGIVTDSVGNIYITGMSEGSWGDPINLYLGNWDIFVARLNSNGDLLWNTFHGTVYEDECYDITLDSTGNIYITGYSDNSWGNPINPPTGITDVFVAKLDSSGNLLGNTFFGGDGNSRGRRIVLDDAGNMYVTGQSSGNWGSPIIPYTGGLDAFAAKLNNNGKLLWNTLLGSESEDRGLGIAVDSAGKVYVTGFSYDSWGSPKNSFAGVCDSFVSKHDNNGNLMWNTFLGSELLDRSYDITSDNSGNIYVTGESYASWGDPIHPYVGDKDAFAAKLDRKANLLWNTFLGSDSWDDGLRIALYGTVNMNILGYSRESWGDPIAPHSGNGDTLVARITQPPQPIPSILANGSDGPVTVTQSDTLQITISLISNGLTDNADWWLIEKAPFGTYHYNLSTKSWDPGLSVTYQGPLFDLSPKKVMNSSGLSTGVYRFYFGVDTNKDGELTKSSLYYDLVKVTVISD